MATFEATCSAPVNIAVIKASWSSSGHGMVREQCTFLGS